MARQAWQPRGRETDVDGAAEFADLEHHWGSAYVFTYDARPGNRSPYTAVRRDARGSIQAADPETLFNAIRQDYQARPVPRSVAP
jgi:hypothetical protein